MGFDTSTSCPACGHDMSEITCRPKAKRLRVFGITLRRARMAQLHRKCTACKHKWVSPTVSDGGAPASVVHRSYFDR